jgi:hypothetical protein
MSKRVVGLSRLLHPALLCLALAGLFVAGGLRAEPTHTTHAVASPLLPALADTVTALAPDGSTRRYSTLECSADAPGGASRRMPGNAPGRLAAGPHALDVPPASLRGDADVSISTLPGSGRGVRATVEPAEAIAGDLQLTLSYRGCAVTGNGAQVRIVNLTRGIELPNPLHTAADQTVTAQVREFSDFILVEPIR